MLSCYVIFSLKLIIRYILNNNLFRVKIDFYYFLKNSVAHKQLVLMIFFLGGDLIIFGYVFKFLVLHSILYNDIFEA